MEHCLLLFAIARIVAFLCLSTMKQCFLVIEAARPDPCSACNRNHLHLRLQVALQEHSSDLELARDLVS